MLETDVRFIVDLGDLGQLARIHLNGNDLGVVWKPPYSVDVTGRLKPGRNQLSVDVTNTWINRLIGDAGKPVAERIAFVQTPAFPKMRGIDSATPLQRSGLMGPVRIGREVRVV